MVEPLPPGLRTVTLELPEDAIKVAGTDAVSCVALTNEVKSGTPFHNTVAPDTKPVPFSLTAGIAPSPCTFSQPFRGPPAKRSRGTKSGREHRVDKFDDFRDALPDLRRRFRFNWRNFASSLSARALDWMERFSSSNP